MGVPVLDVATIAVGIINFTYQFIPPARRTAEYGFNRLLPNQVPSVVDTIELRKRGLIGENMYYEYLLIQGWDKPQSRKFWEAAQQQLSSEALVILKWREEISGDEYLDSMKKLGYDRSTATQFEKSLRFYPSPSDLVLWQAKEVFEEDAVKKYGLDNEYELINKEAFYKAGMSEEQIKNYWRAHWQHPSLSMIYEMYHRGYLTEEDVYEYYRLVEIPPYWRDMLTRLSHQPYTRVDTRRMYELGILTRDEVKRNYMDLGYDEEKAENMTLFTVAYATQTNKDLSKSQIEKAYEYGIIDETTMIEYLQGLGYDEQESLFILGLKAYSMMEGELDDKVATIKTRFRRGLITESEAIQELDKLEISSVFRDKTIAEIQREKTTEFQLPSKSDLLNWLSNELITEGDFSEYMSRIGFRNKEITLYIRSLKT